MSCAVNSKSTTLEIYAGTGGHDNIAGEGGASRPYAAQTGRSGGDVNQLDIEWEQKIAEAQQRARDAGRSDVADYLSLRATNDMARTTGINWLLEAFTTLAGEANRAGAAIALARNDPHRFPVGASTMVGTELTLRIGVRTLTVEAGWPRTPRDGIVRGGGLAAARIGHFGNRDANEDLLLTQTEHGAPQWFVLENAGTRIPLREDRLRRHLSKLIDA